LLQTADKPLKELRHPLSEYGSTPISVFGRFLPAGLLLPNRQLPRKSGHTQIHTRCVPVEDCLATIQTVDDSSTGLDNDLAGNLRVWL
ncbi:MAG: hypothetical protein V3U60_09575, partial [Gammaproteobacteria bacterium]